MIKIQKITSATKEGLSDINRLLVQLSPTASRLTMSEYRAFVADKANLFFVAKDANHIMGMATLVMTRAVSGRQGWIEDVVVDDLYRGQGIGGKLCNALIAAAKKNKLAKIKLTTNPERKAANKLYQKLGFDKYNTNVYRMKLK